MSCSSLEKKLLLAKKACKGFTSKLQRKLQNLKISKPIANTTTRINPKLAKLLRPSRSIRPRVRRKTHLLTRQSSVQNSFASVHVDDLFKNLRSPAATEKAKDFEASTVTMTVQRLSSMEIKLVNQAAMPRTKKGVVDEWKNTVSRLPQLRGVDERAEEFIAKFREDMKLQRERSLGEYQEMLARGA